VRRGAARPRRSDQAAAGETLSRAGRRPHRRACMGCRAPQAPSTGTRLGVPARGRSAWWPGGPDAGRAFVSLSASSASVRCPVSGVRCPVSATSVHACLSTGRVSSVRCGRLSVQVSAVRRPLSGVRCGRPVSVRCRVRWSGRSEVLGRGGGAGCRTAGMAGVGVVARCVHARLVVCPRSEPRARGWRRRCWASRGVGVDLAVVVGRCWAVASSTAWPTRIGRVRARIVRWWEPVRGEARLLRQADRHAAGESLGRSCRVEPNIKKPIGHIPLAKQN